MTMNDPNWQRRTKIIATLGPATDVPEMLAAVIRNGVNIARLNFSHSDHDLQRKRIEMVRAEARRQKRIVGILADLQGPKIRIAKFSSGKVQLSVGDPFVLDASLADNAGDQTQVGIDYKALPNDVKAEDTLLLDDGRITMHVESVTGPKIVCRVTSGGTLSNHKGINRLGGGLSAKALTDKDKRDLAFAVQHDVDYIAISFPRNADDIHETHDLIEQAGGDQHVIAKIERAEAVLPDAMDAIIEASHGVMVARGDLAVEIGDAQVPVVQKHLIHRCRALNKPVIIATQMMESMIHSTVPTRAEVSDVANAVLDYADAVMLSAETAVGDNPDKVVAAMAETCIVSEQVPLCERNNHIAPPRFKHIDEAIAMATMYTANHFDIKAVVALTESGRTPLYLSRVRTTMPIYALSRNARTLGRMALYRDVFPIAFDVTQYMRDEVNRAVVDVLQAQGVLAEGDRVAMTKGDFLGVGGGTNSLKILVIGDVV